MSQTQGPFDLGLLYGSFHFWKIILAVKLVLLEFEKMSHQTIEIRRVAC